jgi:hypothetical protein
MMVSASREAFPVSLRRSFVFFFPSPVYVFTCVLRTAVL